MDELAVTPLDSDAGMDPLSIIATTSPGEAPLSRFELLAVRVGAWAGGVAERWAFSSGPFFAFDGRLAAQYDGSQPCTPEACPGA